MTVLQTIPYILPAPCFSGRAGEGASIERNPTMHIINSYPPDIAEEVFTAVRAFMRHLATKLSE
jgi:hypothetical protein